jgi:mono/diheme cytochrome c family protein
MVAPDGRRLFVTNCSSCHGRAVAFNGEAEEVKKIISEGGLHLEMPPWQEKLSPVDIDILARYVMDPRSEPEAAKSFDLLCSRCHGERIPASDDFAQAQEFIATGGSHETMPVWGDVLTSEQLDALVTYTLESSSGAPLVVGQDLYAENCADCHGGLGEGGHNPARPDDIIAPISTAEYLKTRDDFTLRNVIAQGQPNFGMSPFGSAFGGPLDDDEIDALVTYIRAWQLDPPVELPPEVSAETVALSGFEIFSEICAQCHGTTGAGDVGPSLRDANFRTTKSSQDIYDTVSEGHGATEMISWGSILTAKQIQQLVKFIEQLPIEESKPEPVEKEPTAKEEEPPAEEAEEVVEEATPESIEVSFSADISPMLEYRCIDCHGTDGGYDVSTYDLVINSGDNGPAVIPGDAENSLLAQKAAGTHQEGDRMPPPPLRALQEDLIQLILDWIEAGAPDN